MWSKTNALGVKKIFNPFFSLNRKESSNLAKVMN